jgi:CD109 antigen
VEVAIFGEPGAYVGLSGIDSAFYTMQAGNELTYAKVITKMSTFDEQTNGTFKHTWISHQGEQIMSILPRETKQFGRKEAKSI